MIENGELATSVKEKSKTQNLLDQRSKDKSNWLNSLSFPAWSKSMNFVLLLQCGFKN